MNDETSQQIKDIYDTLPQAIKDVLSSDETSKKLQDISTKHRLHIDQGDDLENLTTMVMLGIVAPDQFITQIQNDVRVSQLDATAIANDINENILRPIKDSLMKIYKDDNLEDLEEETKPVEDFSTLRAKDILSEIENPVKTESLAVAAKPTPVKPLVESTGFNLIKGSATPVAIAPRPSAVPTPSPLPAAPQTLPEQKLSQTVRAPEPQKIDLTPKPVSKLPPLTNRSAPSSGSADPYRESVI